MPTENKTLVSESEIENALESLDGWEYDSGKKLLRRVWKFEKFVPTMKFVRKITEVMDANNHHSDLNLDSRAKELTVEVTTHSENAVTQADLDFAKALSEAE